MAHYRFEVKQAGGQVATGTLSAGTMAEAGELLRRQGHVILALAPYAAQKKTGGFSLAFLTGPSLKDVLAFTNQLAVMIKAGISLRAAIEGIGEQTTNPKFKDVLDSIKRDLEGGKQLSDALARFPKTFSVLYVNMVRASELSGSFGKMLDRIANYLNQQMETRSMVRSAMIYPGHHRHHGHRHHGVPADLRAAEVRDHLRGQGGGPAAADQGADGRQRVHGQLLVGAAHGPRGGDVGVPAADPHAGGAGLVGRGSS